MSRLDDLRKFYEILSRLEQRLGGALLLKHCHGHMDWPARGVYFFFEDGEGRTGSGASTRVVRVGTHALMEGSRTTLWNRLSQHRGRSRTESGNHRGSIFRLLLGIAIKGRSSSHEPESWGIGADPGKAAEQLGISRPALIDAERKLEAEVSRYIKRMPFLIVALEDAPGPQSARGTIERNSIALLSHFGRDELDPPSRNWLGLNCDRPKVRESGLWNNNHVDEDYDPAFLDVLSSHIEQTHPLNTA